MLDTLYTNGVIAVKEKSLLGEKLLRLTEMTAEEALRVLLESGFGGGASSQDGEELCLAEEHALDAFIREYAPSAAEKAYLLAPRDYHNAKALCKAVRSGTDAEKMLAPDGLIPVAALTAAIREGTLDVQDGELKEAVKTALEAEEITGAEIGALFDRALYRHLKAVCKHNPRLKRMLAGRADRTNILTAMRAEEQAYAEALYVGGGTLSAKELSRIFDANADRAEHALDGTACADFYQLCLAARERKLPYTEAERVLESYEAKFFSERRFELEGKEPFLYYVFRRRAEIQNVRIVLVCLNAGLPAQDIKRRLRAI